MDLFFILMITIVSNTIKVSKNVKLTCSTEIISDIAINKGPKNTLFHLVILVGDLDNLKMKSNKIVGLILVKN